MEPPTFEELVKEVRIPPTLLDRKCTDEHLKKISLFLDWRTVAPHLGLSDTDIQDIDIDKRKESEKRLETLQQWKRKCGFKAKYNNLVQVLLDLGNADHAERVCRLLQSHTGDGLGSGAAVVSATCSPLATSGPTKQLPSTATPSDKLKSQHNPGGLMAVDDSTTQAGIAHTPVKAKELQTKPTELSVPVETSHLAMQQNSQHISKHEGGVSVESEVTEPVQTKPPHLALEMRQKSQCIGQPSTDSPLAIYQLPLQLQMRNTDRMTSKCSIGTKTYPPPTEKVLMVMGAIGAGKSSLINGMVNYIMGVEWEDDFRFKLVVDDHENEGQTQAKSQTKWITAYTLHQQEGSTLPYTLTILDTPGFGGTEGLERDRRITQQIRDFFALSDSSGIDHLDGIGFVVQSSRLRLTPTQQYIFNSILAIFGKDVAESIFMMVTFADGRAPPVMAAIKDSHIPCFDSYYKFNNSTLFASNEVVGDEEESFDKMFWKMGMASFKRFFGSFRNTTSISLQLTRDVLNEREQLGVIINELQPQINAGLNKIEMIRKEEIVLQQREAEIATNKKFTFQLSVAKQRKVDISGQKKYVTNCLRCNNTCHSDCIYANDADKVRCSAMGSNGHCKVCPGKCIWNQHFNTPYYFESYTEEETQTSEDLERKYYTAMDGKSKVESMRAAIEHELEDVHTNVLQMIHQVQQCLTRLDEIAQKRNPLTKVEYFKLLIESEKHQARPGWQQRVHYYEAAKEQADMVKKLKNMKDLEKQSWYNRFTFW